LEKGVDVKFKALPDLTHQALKQGLIDENMSKQTLTVNSLRNKVYHEGYIPRAHEAESALAIAKKYFQVLSLFQKCTLHDIGSAAAKFGSFLGWV